MTIEAQRNPHPEGRELHYDVHCWSCEGISLEDGNPLDPPLEIAGIEKNLPYAQAFILAKNHEAKYLQRSAEDHRIVIREFDPGKIRFGIDVV